jgi:ribosomal protein S18 acetylase RimI-like enzyme
MFALLCVINFERRIFTSSFRLKRVQSLNTALQFITSTLPGTTKSVLEPIIDEKASTPQKIVPYIREAKRNEIATVVSLRVHVFYPELRTMAKFHARIYDKLIGRINRKGSVCLTAYRDRRSATELGKASANDMFGNILGTIEISPADFQNTEMEHVGSPRKLYCCDLAVAPAARRRGLATTLLKAVEEYASAKGHDELYLHVEKGNAAAEALYLREGYQLVPRVPWSVAYTEGHLPKGYDNYLFLWKRIDTETEIATETVTEKKTKTEDLATAGQAIEREDAKMMIE